MSLGSGSRLGPYEILGQIGAGGMGEVYRAKDPRLGRDVAIKVLPASFSADADRLRRFEQEAKAAGVLNHPNITIVYDIGANSTDGAPYVVQELLEGETLRSELAGGRFSTRKAIDFATQIAHGLAAAHDKGIVHRDLKPENLFVTKEGRVKILDFGLALVRPLDAAGREQTAASHHPRARNEFTAAPTVEAPLTEPGVIMGTLGYMSPEQIKGKPADGRSDIFAFGAILYEMLSGKRAFHADSAGETMAAILKEDPPDLSVTNQNISPGLERVVRHCIEKNPERRFQSAHDLAFDLESLSGTSGTPAAALAAPVLRSRRRRLLALSGIAALLLVAAAFWAGRRTSVASKPELTSPVRHGRLTFQRGNILYARFAPDGQTVVYSAAWGDHPAEIFQARVGSPESRPLGIANANILSISSRNELAVLLKKTNLFGTVGTGTLARVPLAGGAPRQILEDVVMADWAPNGDDLAVLRLSGGLFQLEYPIGKKLLASTGVEIPRVSPDGATIAVVDHSEHGISLVDRSGVKKPLTRGWTYVDSLAWHPSGKEVWFAGTSEVYDQGIFAVDLSGHLRTISVTTDLEAIHDIARNGDVLVERELNLREVLFGTEGDKAERNLSWLEQSNAGSLTDDGRTLLFDESGEGGGVKGSVYVRATDGSAPVRLGDGQALDLSPDGKWALVRDFLSEPPKLLIVPTGIGEPRTLSFEGLHIRGGLFVPPDGRRVIFNARLNDGSEGDYIVDVSGGKPHKFSNWTIGDGAALSADGKFLAALAPSGEPMRYSLDGGEPLPIPGLDKGDIPIQWSADGDTLYVSREGEIPRPVYRYSFATGKKTLWKEIVPADRTGLVRMEGLQITRDGKHYAYSFNRVTASDLYVVKGWK
jgi:eukaryotic-like serine/threonine-protein kinase